MQTVIDASALLKAYFPDEEGFGKAKEVWFLYSLGELNHTRFLPAKLPICDLCSSVKALVRDDAASHNSHRQGMGKTKP